MARVRMISWRVIAVLIAAVVIKWMLSPNDEPDATGAYISQIYPKNESDREYRVNVIAVHGLGTSSPATWIAHKDTEVNGNIVRTKVNWLEDEGMLPSIIPDARIWTFHYDSNWLKKAPNQRLFPLAETFLTILTDNLQTRKGQDMEPLVFIGSSFGGLLIVEALNRADQVAGRFKPVLLSTIGVVFLGAPLRGTPYATYARNMIKIANLLGWEPSESLLKDLDGTTGVLEDHISLFSANAMEYHLKIRCFYELRRTQVFESLRKYRLSAYLDMLLVDSKSACIDAHPKWGLTTSHTMLNKFSGPENGNYQLVSSRIRELALEVPTPPGDETVLINDRPRRVQTFTQRVELSSQLEKYLRQPSAHQDRPRSVALWGLGGAGKSQLVLDYLHNHHDKYNAIFWINAETPSAALGSFRAISETLGLAGSSRITDSDSSAHFAGIGIASSIQDVQVVKAVLFWLKAPPRDRRRWLVVFDNADDLTWVKALIPYGKQGTVIITSQKQLVSKLVDESLGISSLTEQEALKLLLRSAPMNSALNPPSTVDIGQPNKQLEYATELVTKMGCLALAVDLAGSHISQNIQMQEDLSVYLRLYQTNAKALLSTRPTAEVDDYYHTIMTVWETSFHAVEENSPTAAQMFLLLSCFNRANIPDRLFLEGSFGNQIRRASVMSKLTMFLYTIEASLALVCPVLFTRFLLNNIEYRPLGHVRIQQRFIGLAIFGVFTIFVLLLYLGQSWSDSSSERRRFNQPETLNDPRNDFQLMIGVVLFTTLLGGICVWLLRDGIYALFGDDIQEPAPDGLWFFLLLPLLFMLLGLTFTKAATTMMWRHGAESRKQILLQLEELKAATKARDRARFASIDESIKAKAEDLVKKHLKFRTLIWGMGRSVPAALGLFTSFVLLLLVVFDWFEDTTIFWARRFRIAASGLGLVISMLGMIFSGYWFYRTVMSIFPEDRVWNPWAAMQDSGQQGTQLYHFLDAKRARLVDSLLCTTASGEWDLSYFSYAASVLSMYGLIGRNAEGGYNMHSMVQWWARARLSSRQRAEWNTAAADIFSAISYSNRTWPDIGFQQQMVPHLIELANGLTDDLTHEPKIMNLLVATLRWIEIGLEKR